MVSEPRDRSATGSSAASRVGSERNAYRRILVPLQGFEPESSPVREVDKLARSADTEVILLRVVDSEYEVIARHMPPAGPIDPPVRELRERARLAVERDFELSIAQLRDAGIEHVTPMVVEGPRGEAIVKVAKERGCDAILMEKHRQPGFLSRLFGSPEDVVVRHAGNVAVHLIRPAAGPPAARPRRGVLNAMLSLLSAVSRVWHSAARRLPPKPSRARSRP